MTSSLVPNLTGMGIFGMGMSVPDRILTNEDLAKIVDTNNDWIVSRTGIRERRITDADTATSDLAAAAALAAMEDASIDPEEIDMVICATTSGDYVWPATACVVQRRIGANRAAAFDLSAACSGFCYGLTVASGLIRSGTMKNILLIGADTLTKHLNWQDRATCILFGDGAGAVVLRPCNPEEGMISSALGADGNGLESVWIPAGGTRTPTSPETLNAQLNSLTMRGQEVYRFAIEKVPSIILEALKRVCLLPSDVTLMVMHQANLRIMQTVAKRLDFPMERVFINLDKYGNTSAASIPMALTEAQSQNLLHKGDIVVTVGFGAGLTWGANVIRWNRDR